MARAADILLRLPPVFTLVDFQRATGAKPAVAHVSLTRLAERNWVKNAGVRSSVYFNLLVDPKAAENRVLEAVKRVYPSAVVIGPACLHAHGWTTQIPQVFDVAVLARPSLRQFDGVHLVPRPKKWFAALLQSDQLLRAGESPFSIESVTPAFALEDAREFQDVWVPDPDDLEIPAEENHSSYRP
jgi:hypothetical protein